MELSNCFNEKRQCNYYKIYFTMFISVNSHIKAAHYILLISPRIIETYFKCRNMRGDFHCSLKYELDFSSLVSHNF